MELSALLRLFFAGLALLLTTKAVYCQQAAGTADTGSSLSEANMKTIYLFSGLGADHRAFRNLELPGYKKVFIEWIPPQSHETMEHYAGRIKEQIRTPDPILLGLSFGGMIAVEVAKQIEAEKVILVSSAKTKADLAAGNALFFKWRLYKLVPASMLRQPNFIVNRMFGAVSGADKQLLGEILEDTDVRFFRWAMDNIVTWKNQVVLPHLIHIHGTDDRIIPYADVKADYPIEGGGHLMILNKADTISRIVLECLDR